MDRGSARHIPLELLHTIVQLHGNNALARCARVSKTWSAVARENLWRELPNPVPLLKLLAPMYETYDRRVHRFWYFKFKELADADWQRFILHARHVRALTYDETYGKPRRFWPTSIDPHSLELLASFASSKVVGPLLPNLRSFVWIGDEAVELSTLPNITPFLSPSIVALTFHVTLSNNVLKAEGEAARLWDTLEILAPNLKTLAFSVTSPQEAQWDQGFCRWLQTCEQLECITFPRYWRGGVVDVLASLPRLRSVDVDGDYVWTGRSGSATFLSRWSQEPIIFSAIKNASIDASPLELVAVLRNSTHIGVLTSLSLGIDAPDEEDLPETLLMIAQAFPSLTEFTSLLRVQILWDQITMETLRPLFSCSLLTRFTMKLPRTIRLSGDDVRDMGAAWPRLATLKVQEAGYNDFDDIATPLATLTTFAEAFPNLKHLALTFDTNFDMPSPHIPPPAIEFKALKVLSVRASYKPSHALDAGFFLASLCRADTELRWNPEGFNDRDDEDDDKARVEGWKKVDEVFRRAVCLKETWTGQRSARHR